MIYSSSTFVGESNRGLVVFRLEHKGSVDVLQ
jgi:hypothetical protein